MIRSRPEVRVVSPPSLKINRSNLRLAAKATEQADEHGHARQHGDDTGGFEIAMYGSELLFLNPINEEMDVRIRKRESRADAVAQVRCSSGVTKPHYVDGEIVIHRRLEPREELKIEVQYKDAAPIEMVRRHRSFEVSVALRRILSEVRDEYLA